MCDLACLLLGLPTVSLFLYVNNLCTLCIYSVHSVVVIWLSWLPFCLLLQVGITATCDADTIVFILNQTECPVVVCSVYLLPMFLSKVGERCCHLRCIIVMDMKEVSMNTYMYVINT